MEYRDFDEIDLPNRTPTDPNPAHRLDFQRFTSDTIREFQRVQVEVLRQFSPDRPITHNFMAGFTDFDHFEVAQDLDFASWDAYPLGFLASFLSFHKGNANISFVLAIRTSVPSTRSLSCLWSGRWWVMEQQPGPVNWVSTIQFLFPAWCVSGR
jgi:beta-galactosidase